MHDHDQTDHLVNTSSLIPDHNPITYTTFPRTVPPCALNPTEFTFTLLPCKMSDSHMHCTITTNSIHPTNIANISLTNTSLIPKHKLHTQQHNQHPHLQQHCLKPATKNHPPGVCLQCCPGEGKSWNTGKYISSQGSWKGICMLTRESGELSECALGAIHYILHPTFHICASEMSNQTLGINGLGRTCHCLLFTPVHLDGIAADKRCMSSLKNWCKWWNPVM